MVVHGGVMTDPQDWVDEGFEPGVHSLVRAPRTAIGVTADGRTLMVTADGRRPGITHGFTIAELARYMIALGAVEALSLDGGGSSQMVVDGILRNVPCCDDVVRRVRELDCPLVELTGGEPLLQPGALPLLERLCDLGLRVLLETGGGLDISPVDPRVHRIVDVKCPGSGEHEANLWSNLDELRGSDEVKFVLADEEDYLFAREVIGRHRLVERCPVHFSVVFGELEPASVAAWILRDRLAVRLQPQLHKLLWGAETRGV